MASMMDGMDGHVAMYDHRVASVIAAYDDENDVKLVEDRFLPACLVWACLSRRLWRIYPREGYRT